MGIVYLPLVAFLLMGIQITHRILHELVLHKDMYLDNDFLSRGCVQDASCQKQLPRVYAQYSDMYVPGMLLDERTIENIFIMETLKIRLDRSYMGIWQIHALSSVLNAPVFSQNLEIQMYDWI